MSLGAWDARCKSVTDLGVCCTASQCAPSTALRQALLVSGRALEWRACGALRAVPGIGFEGQSFWS